MFTFLEKKVNIFTQIEKKTSNYHLSKLKSNLKSIIIIINLDIAFKPNYDFLHLINC